MYVKAKSKLSKHKKSSLNTKKVANEEAPPSSIELEDDDPCKPKKEEAAPRVMRTPGLDPRFQQQNQTLRCYVMYSDFYHCEQLLGEGTEACTWFKDVFTSICPQAWVEKWDEYRSENRMPWYKRANFAEAPYGK